MATRSKPIRLDDRKFSRANIVKDWKKNKVKYLLLIPLIVLLVLFNYLPMGGIVMAFSDYSPKFGIFGSLINRFVGLKHFRSFFDSIYFERLMRNTVLLNVLDLLVSFPLTIILALLLNEVKNKKFKSLVQMISYLPYFISMVVVGGIVVDFCKSTGLLGELVGELTGKARNLLGVKEYWRPIYIISGLWQSLGFGTIIYLAALSGVDQELYEAAELDGAGYMQRLWHITLPSISNTIIIMLILKIGGLMGSYPEKTILMANSQIYETADVIGSYVYRKGLQDGNYSFATAINLFNSVINLALLTIANKFSKKFSETSLF